MTRPARSLRRKTTLALLAAAGGASLVLAVVWYVTALREQRRLIDGMLVASAARAATAVEGHVLAAQDAARIQTRLLSVQRGYLGDPETRRRVHGLLTTFRASDPLNIVAIAVTDLDGRVQVATDGLRTFGNRVEESLLQDAVSATTPLFSPVRWVERDERYGRFRVLAAIRDGQGTPRALLIAEYSTFLFERVLREQAALVSPSAQGFLYERNLIRLAGTVRADALFRTNNVLVDSLRDRLVAERRLKPTAVGEEVRRAVRDVRALADSTFTYAIEQRDEDGRWQRWLGASAPIGRFGGQVTMELPDAVALGTSRGLLVRDAAVLIVLVSLTVGAVAILIGRWLTQPLLDLTETVRRFGGGDRSVRSRVVTDDETGQLAVAFNELADRVENLVVGLNERTQALEADIAERERLEAQLVETRKVEAIGKLAGGVAHDFNNLLAVVLANLDFLRESLAGKPEAQDALVDVEEASRRGADLTRQLLTFARRSATSPRTVDLQSVVAGSERLIQRMVGPAVQVRFELLRDPVCVKIDPTQLQQVLLNLAVNARDAMPAGGTLTVAMTRTGPAGGPPKVLLEVRDTGDGMSPDVVARIFDPFFTTKEAGRGTGLGLATVQGIVSGAGGTVTAESTLGAGTTFRIVLPVVEGPPEADAVTPPPPPPRMASGAAILVVDDEPGVRHAVSRTLRRGGYEVFEAGNGLEGVTLARLYADRLALVISDVMMPGGDGHHVADVLSTELPRTPVLLMSGQQYEAAARPRVAGNVCAVLAKPFSAETLLQEVAAALAGRATR